jgi:solute carrier family 35 protein
MMKASGGDDDDAEAHLRDDGVQSTQLLIPKATKEASSGDEDIIDSEASADTGFDKKKSSTEPPPVSRSLAIQICVFYGLCSISMGFVNKTVLSSYKFDCVFFLLLSQRCLCLLFTCCASRPEVGIIDSFGPLLPSERIVRSVGPLTALDIANVVAGLVGLKMISIPIFYAFRKLTTLCVLALDVCLRGQTAKPSLVLSLTAMVVGSGWAGFFDSNGTAAGYAFVLVNDVLTALYVFSP